jgi:hypothetical protein
LRRKWLAAAPAISRTLAYLSLARRNYQPEQAQAAESFFWQPLLKAAGVFERRVNFIFQAKQKK